MQIGHQLRLGAMRLDQVIGHVVRMRGGVADPLEPLDPGQFAHQPAQAPDPAVALAVALALAVITVDVLAKQGDLLHPLRHQLLGLGKDARNRARDLGAAGIGHDAEGAELVAAFLHRQEGGGATGRRAFGQLVELVLDREFGVDGALAAGGGGDHLGQAVIVLRTDDQIDERHPAHDLGALGLRNAAGDADLQIGLRLLERAQPAEVGIDLLGRLLADVAGVEQHHVRLGRIVCQHIALRAHGLGHALAVIDVHLAAVGLDVQFLRRVRHGDPPRFSPAR
ncbi:hypothetical protein SDC9_43323 [bioreactor metagenome]|uniref:NAD-specific glutamate dehydrogenase n=1 Tax=bioreactor metagenome TaxID=1076179 RepID=A0A644W064_9ZZZZ